MTDNIHLNDVGTILQATIKSNDTAIDISNATTKAFVFTKPDGTTVSKDASFLTNGSDGVLIYYTESDFLNQLGDWKFQGHVITPSGDWNSDIGYFVVYPNVPDLDTLGYLVRDLRLHIGDIDSTAYQYLDEWLIIALTSAVKALQRWWGYKYLIDQNNKVSRNTSFTGFIFPEPPIIERSDERAIVLMASIIIKRGTLQNSAWTTASWRDAELAYSNLEAARTRKDNLKDDWDELTAILKIPQKKLIGSYKSSLPGYLNNQWERED